MNVSGGRRPRWSTWRGTLNEGSGTLRVGNAVGAQHDGPALVPDAMIGTRIESSGGFPVAECILTAAAMTSFAVGVSTANVHWGIFAALPAALAIALWAVRSGRFSAELTAEGLQLGAAGRLIPYAAMRAIERTDGVPRNMASGLSYPLELLHDGGTLRIPVKLKVSSQALHNFLASRIPPRAMSVNPQLEDHWQKQTDTYGPDRVWTFVARDMIRPRKRRRALAIALAGIGVSICWIVLGGIIGSAVQGRARLADQWFAWAGIGVLGLLIWLLVLLFANSGTENPQRGIKNPNAACLVVSPQALALVQGDLSGELQWREVRGIKVRRRNAFFRAYGESRVRPGLHLDVAGATVWIADIYDQPLDVIEARIRQCWQH